MQQELPPLFECLKAKGFPSDQLTAIGYGESRPLLPNKNKEGKPIKFNMAQNRRVVIKVIKPRPLADYEFRRDEEEPRSPSSDEKAPKN